MCTQFDCGLSPAGVWPLMRLFCRFLNYLFDSRVLRGNTEAKEDFLKGERVQKLWKVIYVCSEIKRPAHYFLMTPVWVHCAQNWVCWMERRGQEPGGAQVLLPGSHSWGGHWAASRPGSRGLGSDQTADITSAVTWRRSRNPGPDPSDTF